MTLRRFLRGFMTQSAEQGDQRSPEEAGAVRPGKYIVVGLGNPGSRYAGNRHNVGFWCVNRLADRYAVDMRTGKNAATGHARIDGSEVLLVKPRTYVNRSGQAVAPLMRQERVPIENVIVIYDDLDLPEGRIRLRRKGSHGGYNGLKSIIDATGSSDFGRVRIGIGRPIVNGAPSRDPEDVVPYVLSNPTRAGKEALEGAVERACDAIEAIVRDGWERAMNVYNAG